jgi:hypothetical protein
MSNLGQKTSIFGISRKCPKKHDFPKNAPFFPDPKTETSILTPFFLYRLFSDPVRPDQKPKVPDGHVSLEFPDFPEKCIFGSNMTTRSPESAPFSEVAPDRPWALRRHLH